MRESSCSRRTPRVETESGRCVPLSIDAACSRRARSRHQQGSVLYTNLPCLSECRRNASHRPRGNQEKPHRSTYRSSALDTDSTKNHCRRCRRHYSARPRRRASTLHPQECPQRYHYSPSITHNNYGISIKQRPSAIADSLCLFLAVCQKSGKLRQIYWYG